MATGFLSSSLSESDELSELSFLLFAFIWTGAGLAGVLATGFFSSSLSELSELDTFLGAALTGATVGLTAGDFGMGFLSSSDELSEELSELDSFLIFFADVCWGLAITLPFGFFSSSDELSELESELDSLAILFFLVGVCAAVDR